MPLSIPLPDAAAACAESVDSFVVAAESLSEYDLLAPSRCHGWDRLDVVTHTIGGWQEMLAGFVSPVAGPPTVDAASYWPAFDEQYGGENPVDALMRQRRRTAAFARQDALAQLRDVGAAVRRGVASATGLWDGPPAAHSGSSTRSTTAQRSWPASRPAPGSSPSPSAGRATSPAGPCRRARPSSSGRPRRSRSSLSPHEELGAGPDLRRGGSGDRR